VEGSDEAPPYKSKKPEPAWEDEQVDTVAHQKSVVHRSWKRPRPVIDHGEGIYLYDQDGERYIDGSSGTSVVVNYGHGVQSIVEAMYEQGKRVAFAAPHVFTNEPMLAVGERIADHAPGSLRNNCRTWFSCTGTDAVDDAVRLARQYWVSAGQATKYVVISRWQSFHGNQLGVAGIAGHTERRRLFYPMFLNSPHIPPAYCYRCPFGDSQPDCGLRCAHALETMVNQIGEENVAAFIAEPVVGAALGAVPAPDGYFDIIREICDRRGILLIVDEVMTAWGRTGNWFAMDHYGVTPDIIATSKGLTGGYSPVAATIAKESIWDTIETSGNPFFAGHTLSENPVAFAAAMAALDFLEGNDLIGNSKQVGAYLLERLQELLEYDIVGEARGRGLMCALELVKDQTTREPFPASMKVSQLFHGETLKRGLILFPCTGCVEGVAGDMTLVTPPLISTREQVDEIIAVMKDALGATVELVRK
jgi:adenosylmethionine-8-amino-7-oxononanoate aminotransferase